MLEYTISDNRSRDRVKCVVPRYNDKLAPFDVADKKLLAALCAILARATCVACEIPSRVTETPLLFRESANQINPR